MPHPADPVRREPRRHQLWCDLETTGLGPDAVLLEAAFVLLDDRWEELWCGHQVLWAAEAVLARMDPVVAAMHERSGLRAAVAAADPAVGVRDVQAAVVHALGRFVGAQPVYLAGSGVSHFDQALLARDMPELARWLHYATVDVGVVRRFLRACGLNLVVEGADQRGKSHRALADVRQHLAEARGYRARLREVFDVGATGTAQPEPAPAADRGADGDHPAGRGGEIS